MKYVTTVRLKEEIELKCASKVGFSDAFSPTEGRASPSGRSRNLCQDLKMRVYFVLLKLALV